MSDDTLIEYSIGASSNFRIKGSISGHARFCVYNDTIIFCDLYVYIAKVLTLFDSCVD